MYLCMYEWVTTGVIISAVLGSLSHTLTTYYLLLLYLDSEPTHWEYLQFNAYANYPTFMPDSTCYIHPSPFPFHSSCSLPLSY